MDAVTFETARGDDVWKLPPLTADQVRALPAVVPLPYVARAWQLGESMAYRMARAGTLPCKVIKLGARGWVATRADLMKSLGIEEVAGPAEPAA